MSDNLTPLAVNTTWNPADQSASITLSNGNLTATNSAGPAAAVRSVFSSNTGKYYLEYLCTTWSSGTNGVGLANASASLATAYAGSNVAYVQFGGSLLVNGSPPSGNPSLGGRANGDIIGVAFDLTNNLIWFRVCPSGNWNGSGTANPATGAGGASISPITTGSAPLYGIVASQGFASSFTANFGDSAFSGTVPAGYAAGFPATTASVSGVQNMAFVAGPTVVLGAGAAVALPTMVDVGGNGNSYTLYSHMRVPGGTTYTFDNGVALVVPATTDTVFAVPPGARTITATAASTMQLGSATGQ